MQFRLLTGTQTFASLRLEGASGCPEPGNAPRRKHQKSASACTGNGIFTPLWQGGGENILCNTPNLAYYTLWTARTPGGFMTGMPAVLKEGEGTTTSSAPILFT